MKPILTLEGLNEIFKHYVRVYRPVSLRLMISLPRKKVSYVSLDQSRRRDPDIVEAEFVIDFIPIIDPDKSYHEWFYPSYSGRVVDLKDDTETWWVEGE